MSGSPNGPERSPSATLELLFELVKDSPESDLRAVDAIDTKIVQVFAVGAVLLGLPAAGELRTDDWFVLPFLLAVIAFCYLGYQTIRGLWRRKFRAKISPYQLWERYSWDDPEIIKEALVADVADGWVANDGHLLEKRNLLNHALVALGIEAVAIGVALVASATL